MVRSRSLVLALPTLCRLTISLSLAHRNPDTCLVLSSPLTSSHVIATLLLEGFIHDPEFQSFASRVRDRSLYPPSDFQTLAGAQKSKNQTSCHRTKVFSFLLTFPLSQLRSFYFLLWVNMAWEWDGGETLLSPQPKLPWDV